MKKLLLCVGVVCLTLLCTLFSSCNKCSGNANNYVDKIQYSLTIDGQTDGLVDVTYKTIEFQANGTADLKFKTHSSDSLLQALKSDMNLDKALISNNKLYQEAASRVATDLDEFRVTSGADGHYYIHITGFAKEPITGLVFAIDRTFTNNPVQ